MAKNAGTPPDATPRKASSLVFSERAWQSFHKLPTIIYYDVLRKLHSSEWDDTPAARECFLDWKEQRTDEAKLISRWEAHKRRLRQADAAEAERKTEEALSDPVMEFRILSEEKAQRDAALSQPNAFTRLREIQNEAESKAKTAELARLQKQARAWRRDFYGNEK
jgi:hypothetical protein